MDPTITTTHNNKPTPAPALLNGKKHHQAKHPHPLYRECLKNHAAALGGHAVDGCGEFMPSPSATCDPSSLTCAACGCHRNFHRRLHHNLLEENHLHQVQSSSFSSSDEDEEGQSGPHMLLALSAGVGPAGNGNVGNPAVVGPPEMMPATRKRFRSRFSPEQKEKMYELSEKLGWRMQRRDEGVIEERCREIGIGRGVFKVWMHNNKHNYVVGSTAKRESNANVNVNGGDESHGHGSNGSAHASSA